MRLSTEQRQRLAAVMVEVTAALRVLLARLAEQIGRWLRAAEPLFAVLRERQRRPFWAVAPEALR